MYKGNQLNATPHDDLIQFERNQRNPFKRVTAALASRTLDRPLGISRVNRIYANLRDPLSSKKPFSQILHLLDISYLLTADDLAKIPEAGPLVVIANHPFGGIEGVILADLLLRIRPDIKVLGNYLLERIAPIRDTIITVDPFGRRSSVRSNAKTYRSCLRWLKQGNCLIVFPAGEVSHYSYRQGRVTDPTWSTHIASLVRMSGANVLPVFFPGRNSLLFNLLGMFHPRLRTLMLPRETVARQSSRINLFIGRCISHERMRSFEDDQALTQWMRFNTYFMANRLSRGSQIERFFFRQQKPKKAPKALISPVFSSLLAAEAAALPENNRLLTHKQMTVFIAESEQIPHILREIGRLREKTFREIGEGTGRSMDVDLFDSYYRHLVLWNNETAEVVGAYRIGDTTAILDRFGRKGLYTHALFRFKNGLLQHLAHSLELGRSFIRSEHQRQPNCLALLWKGIGGYLNQHPEYRILFGPVSISNSYQRISKQLMIQFLKRNCTSRELSACVSPRCPFRTFPGGKLLHLNERLASGSIDDISMLISEIERDGKRVPVLIKHYLKLNGQFIAFNVDREFCNAVDGLVVVDLIKTETKLLERFMGSKGAGDFLAYWSEKECCNV